MDFVEVVAALGGLGTVIMGGISALLIQKLRAERANREADSARLKGYVSAQIYKVSATVQSLKTSTVVLEQELQSHRDRILEIAQQFEGLEHELAEIHKGCVRHRYQDQRETIKDLAGRIGKLFDRLDGIKDELRSDRFVTVQQYQRDLDSLANNIDALRESLSDAMSLLKTALKHKG